MNGNIAKNGESTERDGGKFFRRPFLYLLSFVSGEPAWLIFGF